MFRNALFASAIALGAAAGAASGAAHAQAPDVGGYLPAATIEGGGEDLVITYATGGAGGGQVILAQPPRRARARNQTDGGIAVEYLEPENARAGREAWLLGGDEAQVVYSNPH
jgi:hypothetical protein